MKEIWKDIEGYEGIYQVSNLGRVRSVDRYVQHNYGGLKFQSGKILKPSIQNTGYYYVLLYKNGKALRKTLHRIIAKAFIPNPENKPQIDHINGIRTDNRIENLRWVTPSENNSNPHRCISFSNSKGGKGYRKIHQYTLDGTFVKEWDGSTPAALAFGRKNSNHIVACLTGKKPTAYGYKWRYAS